MLITVAPMVHPKVCEPPYLLKILNNLNHLNDDYHFIISRTNSPEEVQQFKKCILPNKKNILLLLSDEAGIIPPFLDELYLVFRTYSNKELYDNKKIFAIPCGFSCGYGGFFGKTDWEYKNMENDKKSLIERDFDIFYSGQISTNRMNFVNIINNIKNNFKSNINITNGFAKGYNLDEYYNLMQNSKIALVPDGAAVPESFRYFESFESNCIVITTYPKNNDKYNNWFYEKSPAIFISDWNNLTVDMIRNLLTIESLNKYQKINKEYFDNYLSTKAVAKYIQNIIEQNV